MILDTAGRRAEARDLLRRALERNPSLDCTMLEAARRVLAEEA